MTERLTPEAIGNLIWEELENAPDGLKKSELLERLVLTPGQWTSGYNWIRDEFAEEQEQPIVLTGDYRYILTCHLEEAIDYIAGTLRGLGTRVRRTEGTTSVTVRKFGPVNGPILTKSMRRLVEDIDDILGLMAAS